MLADDVAIGGGWVNDANLQACAESDSPGQPHRGKVCGIRLPSLRCVLLTSVMTSQWSSNLQDL